MDNGSQVGLQATANNAGERPLRHATPKTFSSYLALGALEFNSQERAPNRSRSISRRPLQVRLSSAHPQCAQLLLHGFIGKYESGWRQFQLSKQEQHML